jgi:hypothetical protein
VAAIAVECGDLERRRVRCVISYGLKTVRSDVRCSRWVDGLQMEWWWSLTESDRVWRTVQATLI